MQKASCTRGRCSVCTARSYLIVSKKVLVSPPIPARTTSVLAVVPDTSTGEREMDEKLVRSNRAFIMHLLQMIDNGIHAVQKVIDHRDMERLFEVSFGLCDCRGGHVLIVDADSYE